MPSPPQPEQAVFLGDALLLGAKVPSIHDDSYDSAQARQATA